MEGVAHVFVVFVLCVSCVFFVVPAGAYVNTLRPQRRPGSAGRARSDDKNKSGGAKKLQRPTTAPGRRREDQQVAHGMSGQMVDAASEEVSGLVVATAACCDCCLLRLVVETCCCRWVRSWSQSFSYHHLFPSLSLEHHCHPPLPPPTTTGAPACVDERCQLGRKRTQ